jgi:thiamine-phosphate pyrophosphorylase
MTPRLPPPLLALAGTSAGGKELAPADLVLRARAAIAAGLRGILLRVPAWDDRETLACAQELRRHLPPGEGWLALHDRPHLARAAGADGVHLGFHSLAPGEARILVGPDIAVGFSSHVGDTTDNWAGADYLFHGPVFETPSKAGLVDPVGVRGFGDFAASCGLPVWALGGLTAEHAETLLAAGASGIAVLSGVLGAPDPARASATFLDALSVCNDRRREA